jgi:uncharacterized membrane protein HdeD (DUF308 family)
MSSSAASTTEQARWASIISGIVMILAGVGTWLHPEWFVPLVGVVAVVEGVHLVWQGLFARRDDGLDGGRIAIGLILIVLGFTLWIYPDKMAPLVLYALSGWAIVFGIFIAILGLKDMGTVSGWWWEVIVGVLMAAFGIAVFALPQQGALTLVQVFSVLVVLAGIARIVGVIQSQ